jgi:hypothetical protein
MAERWTQKRVEQVVVMLVHFCAHKGQTARENYHWWRSFHSMPEVGEDEVTRKAQEVDKAVYQALPNAPSPEELQLLAVVFEEGLSPRDTLKNNIYKDRIIKIIMAFCCPAITTARRIVPSHLRSRPPHSQPPSRANVTHGHHVPYIHHSDSTASRGDSSRRRFDCRIPLLCPGASCFSTVPHSRAACDPAHELLGTWFLHSIQGALHTMGFCLPWDSLATVSRGCRCRAFGCDPLPKIELVGIGTRRVANSDQGPTASRPHAVPG